MKIILYTIAIFVVFSCQDADQKTILTILEITNDTDKDITLLTYHPSGIQVISSFEIKNQNSIIFKSDKLESQGSESINSLIGTDSLVFLFEDGKYLDFKCTFQGDGCSEPRNIYTSYQVEVEENNHTRSVFYNYEISQSDYLNAQ